MHTVGQSTSHVCMWTGVKTLLKKWKGYGKMSYKKNILMRDKPLYWHAKCYKTPGPMQMAEIGI